ncbi:hypothetical protein D7D25_05865 [Proteiniphilum sp. X52]|nr:hypothetical protein D7D25_05865 [Proteiniphilum sp. X52]
MKFQIHRKMVKRQWMKKFKTVSNLFGKIRTLAKTFLLQQVEKKAKNTFHQTFLHIFVVI